MTSYPASVAALGDLIAGLTPGDAAKVNEYLKTAYGIEPCEPTFVQPEPVVRVDSVPPTRPDSVTVVLEGLADSTKKIGVIKVVRELVNCPLATGKTLVESAPKAIKEAITRAEADAVRKKLEEAGARVSVKEADAA
jgi:large subunit ribosomal protein L7/L12